jgi:GNAT superfamily N-acetyltransferase
VRPARARDAKACLAITAEAVAERPRTIIVSEAELWDARTWWRHAVPWAAQGAQLVALVDDRIVGHLRVTRMDERAAIRHVGSFGLIVAASARGIGVGRALLEVTEIWARQHGVDRLTLEVFAGNDRARALYTKAGYVEEGFHKGAVRFPDGSVDVIAMAKMLPSIDPD